MGLWLRVPSVGLGGPSEAGKARTVFKVEILFNGRKHSIEKRYSEFYALHKRIKKLCQVPDFPPKHVPNWMTKVLEQRRQGLEAYLQGILLCNRNLPKEFLDFLKLWHFHQDPKGSSSDPRFLLSHRPVVSFHTDPYVLPPSSADSLPNAVLAGVLQGLYAPKAFFCLEPERLMGPDLRLPQALPSSAMAPAPVFLL